MAGRSLKPGRYRVLAAALAGLLLVPIATAQGQSQETPPQGDAAPCLLVLKTGERDATQKKAGKFIAELAKYLGPLLGVPNLEGRVTNKPEDAVKQIEERRPVFAIVTPAFFLEHEEGMGLVPVAAARRLGHDGEAYSLVVRKGASTPPEGARLASVIACDRRYVEQVVLPGLGEKSVRKPDLKSVRSLADAVYDLTEGGPEAPAAVLLDQASLDYFKADATLWPKLDVLATTPTLPADLVVVFGGDAVQERAERLRTVLEKMLQDEEGRRICKTLQTDGFAAVESGSLVAARKLYRGQ